MEKLEIKNTDKERVFSDNGAESVIFYYNGSNDLLLKYFRTEEINERQRESDIFKYGYARKTMVLPEESLKSKEKKIELIPTIKSLQDEIEIIGPAYENGEFKGYVMSKSNLKPLDTLPDNFFKAKEHEKIKIAFLKYVKYLTLNNNAEGIYTGDFNETNFLTNKDASVVVQCDKDNLKIGDLDFDTKHRFVKMYEKSDANPDYIDSYCLNMFTIAFLNKINTGYFVLEDAKLPKVLRTKENYEILESMRNLDSSYQPKYLIDNIR